MIKALLLCSSSSFTFPSSLSFIPSPSSLSLSSLSPHPLSISSSWSSFIFSSPSSLFLGFQEKELKWPTSCLESDLSSLICFPTLGNLLWLWPYSCHNSCEKHFSPFWVKVPYVLLLSLQLVFYASHILPLSNTIIHTWPTFSDLGTRKRLPCTVFQFTVFDVGFSVSYIVILCFWRR